VACSSSTASSPVTKSDAGTDAAKESALCGATTGVTGACGTCVDTKCCAEVTACSAITGCIDCATGGACDATNQTQADAVSACASSSCDAECNPPPPQFDMSCTAPATAPSAGSCVTVDGTKNKCNPITNQGCDTAAGEACDFGSAGFECYPSPPANTEALCAACDLTNGPACLPGSSCVNAIGDAGATKCARFCCTDADCGAGKCDTTTTGGAPGLCVNK
jgi:hypothetical protein